MKFRSIIVLTLAVAATASAQTVPLASSHAPTVKKPAPVAPAAAPVTLPKPAVKVNGAILTESDIIREMYTIFPYANQHNGFPKDMEPQIRKGATEMVIFEELVYQEAKRRNLDVPPEKLTKNFNAFRAQFPDKKTYELFLQVECNKSPAVLKEKIRRSMLIEKMLKSDVDNKAVVTVAEAKLYYTANAKQFEHAETFEFQTISMIPPQDATAEMKDLAKRKITDAARLGREAKDYQAFGSIAEQISEDDWRTKLGDRGAMQAKDLPPVIVDALRKMKVNEVNGPIAVGTAWVVLRLNKHNPAGKTTFAEVQKKLMTDLRNQKRVAIRAELDKKLRKDAKIEVM